ncbi:MAG TPA: NAD-dependent epimerase/dehydratase family protein, partial [Actinobacteria bacterium]|nr:NAD-dependent epimerase/dehydratase family protein [Actinomycetota bacterium]
MNTDRHVVIGAGPVGTGIARKAVARGHQVTIVTRTGSGLTIPGVHHVKADVTDPVTAREAIKDASVVYQAAQPAYNKWSEKFPSLQSGVATAAAATDAVLVAVENLYMYGPVDRPMTEDMAYAATTKKGAVRGALATELADLYAAGDLRATAGRGSDFYGPGVLVSSLAERVFPKVLAGKNASVLGDPDRLHSYTYIDDFADALVTLGGDVRSLGRAWHVPNAPTRTTSQVVDLAYRAAGTKGKAVGAPKLILRLIGKFNPVVGEVIEMLYEFEEDFVVDHSDFADTFGANPTSLEDGISRTVDWYR